MEDVLKRKILSLLKKGDVLSFTSNSGMQGGPLVSIVLNEKNIGEVYTYNPAEHGYQNIPQGNSFELELANSIKEWVHDEFYEFVCDIEQHHLLRDFFDCLFILEDEEISLKITVQAEDEFGEAIEIEGVIAYESFEYLLTDIVT